MTAEYVLELSKLMIKTGSDSSNMLLSKHTHEFLFLNRLFSALESELKYYSKLYKMDLDYAAYTYNDDEFLFRLKKKIAKHCPDTRNNNCKSNVDYNLQPY